ncbi:MAG TPA: hypothetical protein VNT52_00265, partial [Acidimicrobiales bacterium]|nr:hypothetical protein [Acidimicrobiales bacterium]
MAQRLLGGHCGVDGPLFDDVAFQGEGSDRLWLVTTEPGQQASRNNEGSPGDDGRKGGQLLLPV